MLGNYQSRSINRADLLRCLQQQMSSQQLAASVRLFGFEAPIEEDSRLEPTFVAPRSDASNAVMPEPSVPFAPANKSFPQYRISKRESLADEQAATPVLPDWLNNEQPFDLEQAATAKTGAERPAFLPLSNWAQLWPLLRQLLSQQKHLPKPDIDKLVQLLSQARIPQRIPRLCRCSWAAMVQMVVDYHPRLLPYHQDFSLLSKQLAALRGAVGLSEQYLYREPYLDPLPAPYTLVVLVSDLGHYGDESVRLQWQRVIAALKQRSCIVVGLMPVPLAQLGEQINDLDAVIAWDKPARLSHMAGQMQAEPDYQQAAHAILTRLALAAEVEPELLRATRYSLPALVSADVEAYLWQHPDVVSNANSLVIKHSERARYIKAFMQLPATEQQQMAELIYQYHQRHFPTLRYEEIERFRLCSEIQLPESDAAQQHLQGLARALKQQPEHYGLLAWGAAYLRREDNNPQRDKALTAALWSQIYLRQDDPSLDLPTGLTLADIRPYLNDSARQQALILKQKGAQLTLQTDEENGFSIGSPILQLDVATQWLGNLDPAQQQTRLFNLTQGNVELPLQNAIAQQIQTDREIITLEQLTCPLWAKSWGRDGQGLFAISLTAQANEKYYWHNPEPEQRGFWYLAPPGNIATPSWAKASGRDVYGLYADVDIFGVIQRFRWIEPGAFMMGSPEDEKGRFDNEDYHQVTLSQGFWMADTTVTQALWQMTMGTNPSYFKGDSYPVDNVSWQDAHEFIHRLNSLQPDLRLFLPTEAQWECACRAGAVGVFDSRSYFDSARDLSLGRKLNYRGTWDDWNTWDVNAIRRTTKVKSYPANEWGLFDMQGNLWEWCLDVWREHLGAEATIDPRITDSSDFYVVRGGSWFDSGRSVRPATRYINKSDDCYPVLGFRLCRSGCL